MGASKTEHYSINEIKEALIGRALAHPSRIRIVHLLHNNEVINPIELTGLLDLNKSSVHSHLNKMIKAEIVSLRFKNNRYQLKLNRKALKDFALTMPIHF